ncbi:type II toxin-antitoxin system RelE/ParE family toxin [Arthrobacter sp. NPDC080031]
MRILFAFDPERLAILLVAGDKAGNWSKWYKTSRLRMSCSMIIWGF